MELLIATIVDVAGLGFAACTHYQQSGAPPNVRLAQIPGPAQHRGMSMNGRGEPGRTELAVKIELHNSGAQDGRFDGAEADIEAARDQLSDHPTVRVNANGFLWSKPSDPRIHAGNDPPFVLAGGGRLVGEFRVVLDFDGTAQDAARLLARVESFTVPVRYAATGRSAVEQREAELSVPLNTLREQLPRMWADRPKFADLARMFESSPGGKASRSR